MPPISLVPVSERYLSFAEREELAILHAQRVGVREIARRLGRSASTISREVRRNASTRSHAVVYRATTAQWHAERRTSRPKVSKLAANDALREYVQDRLAGLDRQTRRRAGVRARGAVDRSSTRSPSGSALGEIVESGADREQAPDRLPR